MIKFYRFAWKRFNRKAKMCFLLNFFTSFVNNCSMVLIPILQKEMIERMTNSQLKISYICIYFLCGVAGVLAVIAESVLLSHLERTLQRALQEELIESALKNKNPIIESKGPGAYMVSVFGDSEHISNLLETNIVNIFFQCISTIVILVITAQWSKAFVGIVMVSYLVMIVLHFVSDKAFIKKFQAAREKIYEANPRVLECIENRLSVMGFADINRYMKEIYQIFDERDGFMKQANTINSASVSALGGIRILALSIFFIVSVCQMNAGKMEIASFIAMLSYFSTIFVPITLLKQYNSNKHQFTMFYNKIKDSLCPELRLKIPDGEALALKNCFFSYENASGKKALSGLSMEVGAKIGVVGLSGEGKSTIIKMVLGELLPTDGVCCYGEKQTSDISRYLIQTAIRYAPQEPEMFNGNLEFNITLGKAGISAEAYVKKESECKDCVQKLYDTLKAWNRKEKIRLEKPERELLKELFLLDYAQVQDSSVLECIVQELPEDKTWFVEWTAKIEMARHYYLEEKYNRLLSDLELLDLEGRKFGQRGCKISGGEKNKIAIARFLLPEYGNYFILDEPFTSLDAISEGKCLNVLQAYMTGMKGIIISHKMNIISQFAEDIYVLENGTISEHGRHKELMAKEGLYHRIYTEYTEKTMGVKN